MITSLKERLRAEAERLGFSLFGVTTPDRPVHYETYEQWLSACRHGEMGYLSTDRAKKRRADPLKILQECQSIVVVGIRYHLPEEASITENNGTGRVAAYAWGEDYHDIVIPRLNELVSFLEQELGSPVVAKPYTDTGPVLERDLAQRAGLGWMGKNTCLIVPGEGSYFLLAEIFLNVQLEPDQPFTADRCGTCSRCIQSCPTSAILPDRTVDATRCISYLTIENKGAIPKDLRPLIGDWIFGCDICQMVCPWNRRISRPADKAFNPRPGMPRPVLRQELHLTPEKFNRKFKGSPVARAKRRGYLRNVAVAIGNLRDHEAIPDLVWSLKEEKEPLIRAHVAWALGQMQEEEAMEALKQALESETDADVRTEIQAALLDFAK